MMISGHISKDAVDHSKLCDSTYFYSKNGDRVFLLSENGTSVLLDKEIFKTEYNQMEPYVIQYLIKNGFLEDDDRFIDNDFPRNFVIQLTNRCNLNCRYCFTEKGNSDITFKTLNDILDYIFHYGEKYLDNRYTIILWGGEPTLLFDLIIYTRQFYDAKGIKPAIEIQSNGTLLNDEKIQELINNDISIGLSIDGPEPIHNSQRLSNDCNSFDATFSCIRKIKNIRGTISVITHESCMDDSTIPFLYSLQVPRVKIHFANPNNNEWISLKDIPVFNEKRISYLIANADSSPLDDDIYVRLRNLLTGRSPSLCYSRGCKGGCSVITFSTDGSIYPCSVIGIDKYRMGTIYDNSLDTIIKKYMNLNRFKATSSHCDKCIWFPFCKGGCNVSRIAYGSEYDPLQCEINRDLYPRLINIILERPEIIKKLSKDTIIVQ